MIDDNVHDVESLLLGKFAMHVMHADVEIKFVLCNSKIKVM